METGTCPHKTSYVLPDMDGLSFQEFNNNVNNLETSSQNIDCMAYGKRNDLVVIA